MVVLITSLGACGGSDDEAEPSSTAAAPTVSLPRQKVNRGFSECADSRGDASEDGNDLVRAQLTANGSRLQAVYEMAGSTRVDDFIAGTKSWITTITTADGAFAYQLGVKFIGDEVSHYIFDFESATQRDAIGHYEANGNTVLAEFNFGALPDNFGWFAVVSLDGDDVDKCP